jgi:hypothetical protein
LKLVPDGAETSFLSRFQAALRASTRPEAEELLENLTDAKRDAGFHRQRVRGYLEACQARASTPEAAIEWFGLLTQRRQEIDRLEFSQHENGRNRILESPDRAVFPEASEPNGRLDLNRECQARPQ